MDQPTTENEANKAKEGQQKQPAEPPETKQPTSGNTSTDIISNIRQNAGNNDAAREMVPDNDGH